MGKAAAIEPKIDQDIRDYLNTIPFRFEKIKVSQTNVNDTLYQRALDHKRCEQYALDWCDLIASPLTVVIDAEDSNRYLVLDGQHTAEAARLHFGNDAELWAKVIDPLPPKDQAFLFVQLNKERVGLSSQQTYKGELGAEDEKAIRIAEIANSFKIVLGSDNVNGDHDGWTVLRSVSGAQVIYRRYGAEVLESVFSIITSAWNYASNDFAHQFMLGLARVIYSNIENFDINRMIQVLRPLDNHAGLYSKAESYHRKKNFHGKINALQYANVLVALYNDGEDENDPLTESNRIKPVK